MIQYRIRIDLILDAASFPAPSAACLSGGLELATTGIDVPIGTPAYAALKDQIRKEILTGQIPHGARLTIAELVDRYGVSQMPVREALQALQGEGLLTILPHKGARVRSLDTRFVRNVYSIRNVIETLLARSSLPNISARHIQQLTEIQRRFAALAQDGDNEQFFAVNREFHHTLYQLADNDEALGIYDRYNALLGSLRRLYGYSPERRIRMVLDHEEVLRALRSRDEESLAKSIQSQCESGMEDLLVKMSQ